MRKRDLSVNDGVQRVREALRIFGVVEGAAIISTNLQVRLDGYPRSAQAEPADPGVAVYWQRVGDTGSPMRCMAVDQYDRVADNLAAIAATLEAMRAIERHGGAQILARAFTGFTALPAPGETTARGWREILGVEPTETRLDAVKDKYRRLSAVHHPDRGGTQAAMSTLNWAWAQAQETLAEIRA